MTPSSRSSRVLRGSLPLTLVVTVGVTALGCSSSKPAFCSDVQAFKTSIQNLGSLSSDGSKLDALKANLAAVQSSFDKLKADAKNEFSQQIAAVQTAGATARTTINVAASQPSASTIAAASVSVKNVVDSGRALATAVNDKC